MRQGSLFSHLTRGYVYLAENPKSKYIQYICIKRNPIFGNENLIKADSRLAVVLSVGLSGHYRIAFD